MQPWGKYSILLNSIHDMINAHEHKIIIMFYLNLSVVFNVKWLVSLLKKKFLNWVIKLYSPSREMIELLTLREQLGFFVFIVLCLMSSVACVSRLSILCCFFCFFPTFTFHHCLCIAPPWDCCPLVVIVWFYFNVKCAILQLLCSYIRLINKT